MTTLNKIALVTCVRCLAVVVLLALAGNVAARPQEEKSQAMVEGGDTRLNYFLGTWKIDRTLQPSVYGPGGKAEGTMKCEWAIKGLVMTCFSEGTWPYGERDTKGKMKVLQVIEYHPPTKRYSFYNFDNMGDAESLEGSVEGSTWSFRSTEKVQGKTVNALWTFKEEGKGSLSANFKVSTTGMAALRTAKPIAEGRNEKIESGPAN
jgi:hypothetical protein